MVKRKQCTRVIGSVMEFQHHLLFSLLALPLIVSPIGNSIVQLIFLMNAHIIATAGLISEVGWEMKTSFSGAISDSLPCKPLGDESIAQTHFPAYFSLLRSAQKKEKKKSTMK